MEENEVIHIKQGLKSGKWRSGEIGLANLPKLLQAPGRPCRVYVKWHEAYDVSNPRKCWLCLVNLGAIWRGVGILMKRSGERFCGLPLTKIFEQSKSKGRCLFGKCSPRGRKIRRPWQQPQYRRSRGKLDMRKSRYLHGFFVWKCSQYLQ